MKRIAFLLCCLLLLACRGPQFIPKDLDQIRSTEDLGLKSQQSYQEAQAATEKKLILQRSHAGIAYSEKCLKREPEKPICLYYNVLNRGIYIKNHIPNYQSSLKLMIEHCKTLIEVDPGFQHGGCYRILGDIYAKAPSFSLNPKNVTRDLEQSVEYLRQAVQVAPDYPLNHLFLARSLEKIGQDQEARQELEKFDRLASSNLDKEYPEWKKEREQLAKKLK